MNKLNPTAVAFWIALSCGGYLLGDVTGAVAGLGIGCILSVLAGGRR